MAAQDRLPGTGASSGDGRCQPLRCCCLRLKWLCAFLILGFLFLRSPGSSQGAEVSLGVTGSLVVHDANGEGGLCHRHVCSGQGICLSLSCGWAHILGSGLTWAGITLSPEGLLEPHLLCPYPIPRLRSVKIEQGKVNDQANTLADLAKVRVSRAGGKDRLRDTGSVSDQRRLETHSAASSFCSA